MRRDHHVRFRCEEEIARFATEWRRAGNVANLANFDIVTFVEKILSRKYTRKGQLQIVFFDIIQDQDPAFVTFRPLTLHIDAEIWKLARWGDPEARFIIAHEIGHIILHDHEAKPFSNDPSLNIAFDRSEHSAEWQANTFAGYFLLPDQIVRAFGDVDQLIASCGVPRKLAEDRLSSVAITARKSKNFDGDVCSKCGNFTLVRNGTCLKCDTCGITARYR
jgi:hypothetical protein